MNGLDLCREYWENVGRPALQAACPELLTRCAVGLVGEGSECFGFDDEISRDHDWGPGFCVWLTQTDMTEIGDVLRSAYAKLPQEYRGYRRLRESAMTIGRVGVMEIGDFYRRYTGQRTVPATLQEWRITPENGLSVATNGSVFCDGVGAFSAMRTALLDFYPEDLRRKKLAARCAVAAQSGQYNYSRCLQRGESVAAFLALGEFIRNIQSAVFLLNKRYMPYYKWSQRALQTLPRLGSEMAPLLDRLTRGAGNEADLVERISALLIAELQREGLSDADSDFLLPHAESVQRHIADERLRAMHLMAE